MRPTWAPKPDAPSSTSTTLNERIAFPKPAAQRWKAGQTTPGTTSQDPQGSTTEHDPASSSAAVSASPATQAAPEQAAEQEAEYGEEYVEYKDEYEHAEYEDGYAYDEQYEDDAAGAAGHDEDVDGYAYDEQYEDDAAGAAGYDDNPATGAAAGSHAAWQDMSALRGSLAAGNSSAAAAGDDDDGDWDVRPDSSMMDPADLPLCSQYRAAGSCSRGDDCPLIHGDLCEVSGASEPGQRDVMQQDCWSKACMHARMHALPC